MSILWENDFSSNAYNTELHSIGYWWICRSTNTASTNAALELKADGADVIYSHNCGTYDFYIELTATWRAGTDPAVIVGIGPSVSDETSYLRVELTGGNWLLKSGSTTLGTVTDSWNSSGTVRKVKIYFNNGSVGLYVYNSGGTLIGSYTTTGQTATGSYAWLNFKGTPTNPQEVGINKITIASYDSSTGSEDPEWTALVTTLRSGKSMTRASNPKSKMNNSAYVRIARARGLLV